MRPSSQAIGDENVIEMPIEVVDAGCPEDQYLPLHPVPAPALVGSTNLPRSSPVRSSDSLQLSLF